MQLQTDFAQGLLICDSKEGLVQRAPTKYGVPGGSPRSPVSIWKSDIEQRVDR